MVNGKGARLSPDPFLPLRALLRLPGCPDHRLSVYPERGCAPRAPKGAHPDAHPEKSFVTSALTRLCPPYTFDAGKDPQRGSPLGKARQAHRTATRPQRFPATSASRHRPDHAQNIARIGRPCRARNCTTPRASDAERTPRNPVTKSPPPPARAGKSFAGRQLQAADQPTPPGRPADMRTRSAPAGRRQNPQPVEKPSQNDAGPTDSSCKTPRDAPL